VGNTWNCDLLNACGGEDRLSQKKGAVADEIGVFLVKTDTLQGLVKKLWYNIKNFNVLSQVIVNQLA
jgi:hypothetical protein